MKQPTYRMIPLAVAAALFLMAVCGCTAQQYGEVDRALDAIDRVNADLDAAMAATEAGLDELQAQIEAADANGDGAISWGELIGAGLASAAAAFLGTNGYRAATAEGRYAKKIGQAKALADATKP